MDPGEMPDGLQPLTQVEEMLIARAHVQMVMKHVRGHQFHYSGHTVTFLQDIVKFSSSLPLLPEDLDIVMLKPPTATADLARFRLQFSRDMKVRRGVVLAWLRHLKQTIVILLSIKKSSLSCLKTVTSRTDSPLLLTIILPTQ
jgi:hypothetical protein